MQTSRTIKFLTSAGDEELPSSNPISLVRVDEEDNVSALEAFETQYYKDNGHYPVYNTKELSAKYADLLEESLKQSLSQVIRLYGVKSGGVSLKTVRAKSSSLGGKTSKSTTESAVVNGGTRLRTKYPISSLSSISATLITESGGTYTGGTTVDAAGDIILSESVYGFVTVSYTHSYYPITVTSTSTKAIEKASSMLLAITGDGAAAAEITYPDVTDAISGVQPDPDDPEWKVILKKGISGTLPPLLDDFFSDETYIEIDRTVSILDIEGTKIERAKTVTLENENGWVMTLKFDLPD